MPKYCMCLSIGLAKLLFYSWSAAAQEPERLNLSWIPIPGRAAPVINAYILVRPEQEVNSREFAFTLILENKSSSSLRLGNPFRTISFSLLNKEGQETIFIQESKVTRELRDRSPIFHTYAVKHISLNGKEISFDPWQADSLTLLPNSKFNANISVTQFWKVRNGVTNTPYRPASDEQIMPLVSGLYRFRVQLSIIEKKRYWILSSNMLKIKIS